MKVFKNSGYSLLEFSLTLPIALSLIIGAFSASKALQTYSLLDQSLTEVLRCLYPVDGACNSYDDGQTKEPDRFNVYSIPTVFQYQEYSYSGKAEWLNLPVYKIEDIRARILGEIRYDVPLYEHRWRRDQFRPKGQIEYVIQSADFPFVEGNLSGRFEPRLRARSSRTLLPQIVASRSLERVSLSVTAGGRGDVLERGVSFRIPRPSLSRHFQSRPCFDSYRADQKIVTDFKAGCDSTRLFDRGAVSRGSGSEVEEYTYIVLDIRGDGSVQGELRGEVEISLWQNGRRTHDLGGRTIDNANDDNFVPRGAPPSYYSADVVQRYPQEVKLHQGIRVPYESDIELRFRMLKQSGRQGAVRWQGSSLAVYAPRFQEVFEPISCTNLTSRVEFAQSPRCIFSHPSGITQVTQLSLNEPAEKSEEVSFISRQMIASNDFALQQKVSQDSALSQFEYQGSDVRSAGMQRIKKQCAAINQAEAGAAPNRGVVSVGVDEGAERIVRGNEGWSICPPREEDRHDATNLSWTEVEQKIPLAESFYFTQSDCKKHEPDPAEIPASLRQYPKLRFGIPEKADSTIPLYTGEHSIRAFREKNMELSCPQIAQTERYFERGSQTLKAESLFNSSEDLGADFIQRLKKDAQSMHRRDQDNLNSQAYFIASRREHIVNSNAAPTSPAIEFRIVRGAAERTLRAAGVLREEIPAECFSGALQCEIEPLLSQSKSAPQKPSHDTSRALEQGYRAVEAVLPGIRRECRGGETGACIELSVDADPHDARYWRSTGFIQLSLPLISKPLTIRRTMRARSEIEIP